jgi:hypothetical protein
MAVLANILNGVIEQVIDVAAFNLTHICTFPQVTRFNSASTGRP